MFHFSTTSYTDAKLWRRRFARGLLFAAAPLIAGAVFAQTNVLSDAPAPQAISSTPLSSTQSASLDAPFEQPEFLPVEEAYPLALETTGDDSLRLVWQMPRGYYLYQHAFSFEITRDGDTRKISPDFPPAVEREDEFFGLVKVYYDSADIELQATNAVAGAQLRVTSQGCADAGLCYPPRTQYFAIEDGGIVQEVSAAPARKPLSDSRESASSVASQGLLFMMLLAFAGGIILNLMPCVLPILSLKVLGFASASTEQRKHHGWLYSAGVVLSFLLVAGVLLGLRGAGQAIGWGFQLQSPGFVIGLAYLFVVMGLALSGVIEMGSRFMNLAATWPDAAAQPAAFSLVCLP